MKKKKNKPVLPHTLLLSYEGSFRHLCDGDPSSEGWGVLGVAGQPWTGG